MDARKLVQHFFRIQWITIKVGWARRDLNPGPRDYESPALTAELQAPYDRRRDAHLAKSLVQCVVRHRGGSFYAAAEEAGKVVRKRLCRDRCGYGLAKLIKLLAFCWISALIARSDRLID